MKTHLKMSKTKTMTMLFFLAAVQFSMWLCLSTGLQPFPSGDPRNAKGNVKYSDVSITLRHDSKRSEYASPSPYAVKQEADSHVQTRETPDVSGDEDALAWNKALSTGMSPLRHDDVSRSDLPPPAYNVKASTDVLFKSLEKSTDKNPSHGKTFSSLEMAPLPHERVTRNYLSPPQYDVNPTAKTHVKTVKQSDGSEKKVLSGVKGFSSLEMTSPLHNDALRSGVSPPPPTAGSPVTTTESSDEKVLSGGNDRSPLESPDLRQDDATRVNVSNFPSYAAQPKSDAHRIQNIEKSDGSDEKGSSGGKKLSSILVVGLPKDAIRSNISSSPPHDVNPTADTQDKNAKKSAGSDGKTNTLSDGKKPSSILIVHKDASRLNVSSSPPNDVKPTTDTHEKNAEKSAGSEDKIKASYDGKKLSFLKSSPFPNDNTTRLNMTSSPQYDVKQSTDAHFTNGSYLQAKTSSGGKTFSSLSAGLCIAGGFTLLVLFFLGPTISERAWLWLKKKEQATSGPV